MERERLHEEPVSVEISGCSKEDARIVFDALCTCFESDRGPEDVPQQLHETRPMVWLGTFEVTDTQECPAPARLSSSVEADAQGGYWAIERLRTTLDSLFTVHDLASASGDQERELHVVLESRPGLS
ncbi:MULTISPECIES: hypothetical protein [Streptomyces]|uniref:Uncharacterized protein n=1 Tax=Streptomyces chartreusis TaxID=1969 RepID=A0A7H8TJ47_STRCX|nr:MULTISPECIES: hypothetical protein [Streptomyces]MBT1097912.1 hypothetical protein [Streptomyces sp. Tu102]QEV72263.1 hypothetical protein CP983_40255 [Streptomyces chartreusis]QKZ23543.1 hypothetical protein HUT05_43005 [Streptomyces chartreusis]RSN80600.1 hypothetical protein DMH26_37325 [Streptomyces sp. WAC 05379]GGX54962.1 hypothetical protein GCM10010321_85280 [Streptomyces chartreusis]